MSSQSFRWRTIVEVAIISVAIYILVTSSGVSTIGLTANEQDVPIARAQAESLVYPDNHLQCQRHDFSTHIFSTSPLVIYVDGFISGTEAQHLIDIRYVVVNQWTLYLFLTRRQLREMASLNCL